MHRLNFLARELRGVVVVVLVGMMIMWLFARLSDDRAEAKAEIASRNTTTTTTIATTTTTEPRIDDNERLCSLANAFREDLRGLRVVLVNRAGDPLANPGDRDIDIGMHPDGDIPIEVREARTVAGDAAIASGASIPSTVAPETTTTTEAPPPAVPPPSVVNPNRIDPLESGLLGRPQEVALSFYTASSALRLGLIDADFDATADHFADFVAIGEPARWDLEELAESDFYDRWVALTTRPVISVDNTLEYIEETCTIRIGNGFLYRERAPELPVLAPVLQESAVDPGAVGG